MLSTAAQQRPQVSNMEGIQMADRFLKRPEVESRTGLKKSKIYEEMLKGNFPKAEPLTINGRAVGWRESLVDKWIEDRGWRQEEAQRREQERAKRREQQHHEPLAA